MIETERLQLRQMVQSDLPALKQILQDGEAMYAYEGAFSDEETQEWLNRQISRYQEFGFGLWAVVLKDTGEMIGQCGLTVQNFAERKVLEVGYLLQKKYWHMGYATEAAAACKEYAFTTLNADVVYSIIRDTNLASQRVALRNGMRMIDSTVTRYRGVEMPHLLFAVWEEMVSNRFYK